MSDVELLREAATTMRQRARDAKKTRYVSTWQIEFSPGVALAVANWLEAVADNAAAIGQTHVNDRQALAVARAYLDGAP